MKIVIGPRNSGKSLQTYNLALKSEPDPDRILIIVPYEAGVKPVFSYVSDNVRINAAPAIGIEELNFLPEILASIGKPISTLIFDDLHKFTPTCLLILSEWKSYNIFGNGCDRSISGERMEWFAHSLGKAVFIPTTKLCVLCNEKEARYSLFPSERLSLKDNSLLHPACLPVCKDCFEKDAHAKKSAQLFSEMDGSKDQQLRVDRDVYNEKINARIEAYQATLPRKQGIDGIRYR